MSNPYGSLPSVTGEFQVIPFVYRQICGEAPPVFTRQATASEADWFEFGFTAAEPLTGNATDGWTDALREISWKIEASEDLTTWVTDEMIDCTTTAIANLDGTFTYWARRVVPLVWNDVMIDLTLSSNRYGKSITAIDIFRTPVSLPGYPYAMPAQAATLQADLRAAGYTGATVTSTSAALTTLVKNHLSTGTTGMVVTMSGASVTGVRFFTGTTISLPGYPYAMPGAKATLQADLRANGVTGAVVMLFQDTWEIILPNLLAEGRIRDEIFTISPGDPFPGYDFFGNYAGEFPANAVVGVSGNVRTPAGLPLRESAKAFFRINRTSLPI